MTIGSVDSRQGGHSWLSISVVALRLCALVAAVELLFPFLNSWEPLSIYTPAAHGQIVLRMVAQVAILCIAFVVIMMRRRESLREAGLRFPNARPTVWATAAVLSGVLLALMVVLLPSLDDRAAIQRLNSLISKQFGVITFGARIASWSVIEEVYLRLACISLLEEFGAAFMTPQRSRFLAILISTTWFAVGHLYLGAFGVVFAGIVGIVCSILYLKWGKSIVPPALCHVVVNLGIRIGTSYFPP